MEAARRDRDRPSARIWSCDIHTGEYSPVDEGLRSREPGGKELALPGDSNLGYEWIGREITPTTNFVGNRMVGTATELVQAQLAGELDEPGCEPDPQPGLAQVLALLDLPPIQPQQVLPDKLAIGDGEAGILVPRVPALLPAGSEPLVPLEDLRRRLRRARHRAQLSSVSSTHDPQAAMLSESITNTHG